MATARTFAADKFTLTLEGVSCGFLDTIEGGDISADVIVDRSGPGSIANKHIGAPKYEPFTVELGLSMSQPVYDWIAATWAGSAHRKDGAITTADTNLNAREQSQFVAALITEVTMPELDATASKRPVQISVTFAPELTKPGKASGKVPPPAVTPKRANAGAFRLELDGLDCSRVRKIDAFTVKAPVTVDAVGDTRIAAAEPGTVQFPNLRVTMADGPAASGWHSWFDDFVIKGQNDESHEKNGAIVYLSPDLKTELGRVVLHNVGIFALRRHGVPSGQSDAVRSIVAELYCERMELRVGKPAPAKPVDGRVVRPVAPAAVTPIRPLGIQR